MIGAVHIRSRHNDDDEGCLARMKVSALQGLRIDRIEFERKIQQKKWIESCEKLLSSCTKHTKRSDVSFGKTLQND
jgi:hypothetical protein